MARADNSIRRSSVEERRVFRTARLEYIEIQRITGMDSAAAELYREADIATARPLRFDDWSEAGLEALMLSRLPVVCGNAEGRADLGWLANAEVLLAAQQHWPATKRVPALVLSHLVSRRTRQLAAGGGLFAASAPALGQTMTPGALHRALQTLIAHDVNPLATALKMNLVRVCNCDPRKLPSVRSNRGEPEQSA